MHHPASAAALLDMFARDGWSDQFHAGFYALLEETPGAVTALVMDGLGRRLGDAHFLGEAVSYLPPEAVQAVVERALASVADPERRETAEDVLAHVALEFPRLLHPYLTRMFDERVNADAYYHAHPWRESGELHHSHLLRVIGQRDSRSHDALRCLLETRTPAAFAVLSRNTELLQYGPETSYLLEVGYEAASSGPTPVPPVPTHPSGPGPREWRRLYPDTSYHLCFPDDYRDGLDPHIQNRDRHPTWRLDAGGGRTQRFGGEGACVCGICARPTQRLLVLDPIPPGLGVTAVARLTLEACLRCLETNEVMEYVHDAEGRPSPHRYQMPGDVPDGESVSPLAAEVRLAPTPARWFWQDWALSNDRQNLSRLGGYPAWIQGADYPHCPECLSFMGFLLQLDATLPGGDGTEPICYEGAYYGFWCDRCRLSAFKWQVT